MTKTTYQKRFEVNVALTIDSDFPLNGVDVNRAVDTINKAWEDGTLLWDKDKSPGLRLHHFKVSTKDNRSPTDPFLRIEQRLDALLENLKITLV